MSTHKHQCGSKKPDGIFLSNKSCVVVQTKVALYLVVDSWIVGGKRDKVIFV